MSEPNFYLASTEGYDLREPRRCWCLRRFVTEGRDDLLLVKTDPPLLGQKYGLGGRDIDILLIAPRHKGASLFPISEWPLHVHVARLLAEIPASRSTLTPDEFELIAWAEIYPTYEDARLLRG